MAKLILKLNGKVISSKELEPRRDYIAGRADDCDFPMEDYRGISRHHLKFYESSGLWYCESLSKFLHPKLGEENFESLEMNEHVIFSLPPYDFEFDPETLSEEFHNSHEASDEVAPSSALVPSASTSQGLGYDEDPQESTNPNFSGESTQVGSIQLVSTLRICYPFGDDNETLKLEGQVWMAGRESDCEIQLHNPKVSRKHFELSRSPEGFFVTDLGSSNGTSLNGTKLAPHEPSRLISGDCLKVLDIEIYFEVKAANLPAVTAPPLNLPMAGWNPQGFPNHLPTHYQEEPTQFGGLPGPMGLSGSPEPKSFKEKLKAYDWKKNKVRVALMALVPLLLIGLLTNSDDPKKATPEGGDLINAGFDHLSDEQKMAIKDSLNLARNLYVQGKYALCLAEIAKLHETVPFYENSKELESFCVQGHELTQRKIDEDRKEREKALVEQKIVDIATTCSEQYATSGTVQEVRACLSSAVELNPDHPKIIELLQAAEDRLRDKELLAQRRAEQERVRGSLMSILSKAQRYKRNGDLLRAISTYKTFISKASQGLPDKVPQAQRELASVSKDLNDKVSLAMSKCTSLGESQKYKEAFAACEEALKVDPSLKEAIVAKENYMSALRRQMRSLYEDAKLEESLGNLETAKEKWRKIVAEDLSVGEYYKRSSIKLKQYGVK
ncbi:FHA domain-containing protein [bacterium]|nr:FHA domain-containing protein [bacterium]